MKLWFFSEIRAKFADKQWKLSQIEIRNNASTAAAPVTYWLIFWKINPLNSSFPNNSISFYFILFYSIFYSPFFR